MRWARVLADWPVQVLRPQALADWRALGQREVSGVLQEPERVRVPLREQEQ